MNRATVRGIIDSIRTGHGRPGAAEQIVGRTAVRLLLAAMLIDMTAVWSLGWVIIRNARSYGISGVSLMGLVYWVTGLTADGKASGRKLTEIRRAALALLPEIERGESAGSIDRMAIVSGRILFTDWLKDISGAGERFLRLFRDSVSGGGAERLFYRAAATAIENGYPHKAALIADRMTSVGMLSSTVAHEASNPNHITPRDDDVAHLRMGGDIRDRVVTPRPVPVGL